MFLSASLQHIYRISTDSRAMNINVISAKH